MAGWMTIKGTHVYVEDGESVEEAFEKTTGAKLENANNKTVNENLRNAKASTSEKKTQAMDKLNKAENKTNKELKKVIGNSTNERVIYMANDFYKKIEQLKSETAETSEDKFHRMRAKEEAKFLRENYLLKFDNMSEKELENSIMSLQTDHSLMITFKSNENKFFKLQRELIFDVHQLAIAKFDEKFDYQNKILASLKKRNY